MNNGTSRFSPGDRVIYCANLGAFGGPLEEGTVTSINERYVFVCYGLPGSTSKATNPADLVIRPEDDK